MRDFPTKLSSFSHLSPPTYAPLFQELRWEDYQEGRKSKAAGGGLAPTLGGGFGATTAQPAAGGFGGFGATAAAQPATSVFGASLSAPKPAGFGLTATTASPFGAAAAKPATAFGATTATPAAGGFGGFGAPTATTGVLSRDWLLACWQIRLSDSFVLVNFLCYSPLRFRRLRPASSDCCQATSPSFSKFVRPFRYD